MQGYRNILVVIQNEADARNLLPKVKRLARDSANARVHAVRVAYESIADLSIEAVDASLELKTFILTAQEEALKDAIATAGTTIDNLESATLWGRRTWEVILHAAGSVKADLIVKAASVEGHKRIIRAPDDWNLLRNSTCPVLLACASPWPAMPQVVTAVDAFDDDHLTLNKQLLRHSKQLNEILEARIDVVSSYPSLQPWTPHLSTFQNFEQLMKDVRETALARLQELVDEQGDLGGRYRVLEGNVEDVVTEVIASDQAHLLIVGTTARKGLAGVLIGNTAERLLHAVQIDVLTVPAADIPTTSA